QPAGPVHPGPRPGDLPGTQEPVLVEGIRRADRGRATHRGCAGGPGGRRLHDRGLRGDGGAVARRGGSPVGRGRRGGGARPADGGPHRPGRPADGRVLMAAKDFLLPDLGEGLEEAEVVTWRVSQGDRVELNQPLVEVNTAKALVEIPSPFAGVVATLHAGEG